MPGDPEWEAAHPRQTRRLMSKKQTPTVQPKAAAKVGPKAKKRARATSIPLPIESPLDLTTESIPAMQYTVKKQVFFDKIAIVEDSDVLSTKFDFHVFLSGHLKAAGDYAARKGFQCYTLSNKAVLSCAGKGEDAIISIQGPD